MTINQWQKSGKQTGTLFHEIKGFNAISAQTWKIYSIRSEENA